MSRAKRIEDYALIGDGETAALVDRDATIEWLCMPRFDSEACFAALLGDRENGCWSLAPVAPERSATRRYRGESLILETEFETGTGRVRITDFMPIRGEAPDVVRIVEGLSGSVEMESELILRFDYGQIQPMIRQESPAHMIAIAGHNAVSLTADPELEFRDRRFCSRFTVKEGERASFVLTWFASHLRVPRLAEPQAALRQTERFWRKWARQVSYDGEHRDEVMRSLIVLKALMHRPTGGIVAACTSSLPERPHGVRNWDYRFCWLRDATLMLLAFAQMGLHEEAQHWIDWLGRAVGGEPIDLQPFFGIDGARRVPEWEAEWLAGFNGARPVRFGNGAAHQLQLDIYGEVIDALYQSLCQGMRHDRQLIGLIAERLAGIWQEPDAGIWESRGPYRRHTYSKAMCWVAFDRTAAWLEASDKNTAAHYRDLARQVRETVLQQGFDLERNSFTRAFGDNALDAALLRLPLVGFIDARDLRMIGTVAAIERSLCSGGLVRRYDPEAFDDGVDGEEGAFVAACFWLAEVYDMQGREKDARDLFARTLARANDLSLLAEELSVTGAPRQLGNFPQGLSHLSLVSAARRLFEPEERQCNREKAASETAPA